MHHPRCVISVLGRGWVRHNTTVLYPIYYAGDDMFRPLWAIFRSQKLIMRETIQSMFISLLLLLMLPLQPTMGFSLLGNFLPFRSFLAQFSPPSYSHHLDIFLNDFDPSFPWSSSDFPPIGFHSNILLGILFHPSASRVLARPFFCFL